MDIEIEERNTFERALKSGINLFLGSGFSVLAKDKKDQFLPCGGDLLNEIKREFPKVVGFTDLSKASTVLEKSMEKESFRRFLTNRFTVEKYDELYNNLLNLNLCNIYSTNIDDLIFKIWNNALSPEKYIHNVLGKGESIDDLAINYFPVHGCVIDDSEYIFSNIKIASDFSSQNGNWESFKMTVSRAPIVFWGWSFNDSDIIEAIYSGRERMVEENERKWVVLNRPDDYEIEFYRSLNFSVINADTKELLEYFKSISYIEIDEKHSKKKIHIPSQYKVPHEYKEASYPISAFFEGDIPRWSYIYSGQLIKIHHYKKIVDMIHGEKTIIVVGIPASGKTTLMMQLASEIETEKYVHLMYNPTVDEAIHYKKIIGKEKVILFIDNCLTSYGALLELAKASNIQVVGFERDNKYESIAYKLIEDNIKYELYDISEINDQDVRRLVESIPKKMYKGRMFVLKDNTIFEAIRMHTNAPIMQERFSKVIMELCSFDKQAAELFLMISYVHSCGVPVSYDMIYSFLNGKDYKMVYQDISRVGKLVTECFDQDFSFLGEFDLQDQDYYKCRTRYLAELIIEKVPNSKLMRLMLNHFVERVPVFKICRYDIFKSSGFDADIVTKYFGKYEDGIDFYKKCLRLEDSAFIYQQMALYSSRKRKYTEAFKWIDIAKNCERKNIFSIRNTHAIILFNANINKENTSDGGVVATLHQSMEILKDCYKNDLRKGFHARIFGEHLLRMYSVYGYDEVEKYIDTACDWLDNEIISRKNVNSSIKKMRNLRKEIEEKIVLSN